MTQQQLIAELKSWAFTHLQLQERNAKVLKVGSDLRHLVVFTKEQQQQQLCTYVLKLDFTIPGNVAITTVFPRFELQLENLEEILRPLMAKYFTFDEQYVLNVLADLRSALEHGNKQR